MVSIRFLQSLAIPAAIAYYNEFKSANGESGHKLNIGYDIQF